eukprot:1134237-Pelagomonas_calceolata.AAC.4
MALLLLWYMQVLYGLGIPLCFYGSVTTLVDTGVVWARCQVVLLRVRSLCCQCCVFSDVVGCSGSHSYPWDLTPVHGISLLYPCTTRTCVVPLSALSLSFAAEKETKRKTNLRKPGPAACTQEKVP